jgi:hypothetical protein
LPTEYSGSRLLFVEAKPPGNPAGHLQSEIDEPRQDLFRLIGHLRRQFLKRHFLLKVIGLFATAASRQASIAEDTEKRQLRAYVGTVPGDIENFGDMAKQRFVLTVRNFGETPAYNVGSQFSYSDVFKPEGSIGVVEAERPCGQP